MLLHTSVLLQVPQVPENPDVETYIGVHIKADLLCLLCSLRTLCHLLPTSVFQDLSVASLLPLVEPVRAVCWGSEPVAGNDLEAL
ncbi:Hypothetical predicted protein [Marmota monax]|uniref:Uncharacterized protein n=1 Tax=Marmota monax TaxID=9995 RepID=A0A5E4AF23_MARMO|nr:hypothetical protein GHT09_014522 [Marmota monax]VTJ55884.1 Hypothetical predicted protein [Marmota monax]